MKPADKVVSFLVCKAVHFWYVGRSESHYQLLSQVALASAHTFIYRHANLFQGAPPEFFQASLAGLFAVLLFYKTAGMWDMLLLNSLTWKYCGVRFAEIGKQ